MHRGLIYLNARFMESFAVAGAFYRDVPVVTMTRAFSNVLAFSVPKLQAGKCSLPRIVELIKEGGRCARFFNEDCTTAREARPLSDCA